MNALIRFGLVFTYDALLYFFDLIIIALLFSVMMIISSFGYVQIGGVALWQVIVGFNIILITLLWYGDVFQSTPILVVVLIGLAGVSLMGATDVVAPFGPLRPGALPFEPGPMRYVGTLAGVLLAEAAALLIAVFAWGGALIGLGGVAVFAPGTDIEAVPPQAWKFFKGAAIISFWLGFAGATAGLATPYVPWEIVLATWLVIVVIIPGAFALPSDTPFKIVFYLTLMVLLVMLVVVIWSVIASLGMIPHLKVFLRVPANVYWMSVSILTLAVLGLTFALQGAYGVLKTGVGRAAIIFAVGAALYWWEVTGLIIGVPLGAPLPSSDVWRLILRAVVLLMFMMWWVISFWKRGLIGLTKTFGVSVPLLLVWALAEWIVWEDGGFRTIGDVLYGIRYR